MSKLQIKTPEVFAPLLEPSRYKGGHGGRGSGKSHFFAELAIEEHLMYPGLRTLGIREVQKSIKESVKRLLEDKIRAMGVSDMFNVTQDRIITPGDGVISFIGMQDHTADSIKSYEGYHRGLVEEAQTMSQRSLELLRPTIRTAGPTPTSEIRFAWNPRNASDPVDQLLRGDNPAPDSIVVEANYYDNPFYPPELEIERAYDEVNNPERYGHIWLGQYEPQAIGAIWSRAIIHQGRRHEAPVMTKIGVSIDHAVSDEPGSDEHGIIIGGLGEDGRGYLLEDASLKGSPKQWAERAFAMYDKWEADFFVIERNQGGDLIKSNLDAVRPGYPVKEVHATRGKYVRAAPISSLYATGKVSHVGTFPELENQMCLMTAAGYDGDGSPDRVDAMVWLFTELFPKMIKKKNNAKPLNYSNLGIY